MSNSIVVLSRLLRGAVEMLLPQACFLCGAPAGRAPVCADCRAELPWHVASVCPVCALPSAGGGVCGACQRRQPAFDATRVAFDYAFPVDVMVKALKYQHRFALANFFADELCVPTEIDLIVPMPLHPARLAERGFNQAVEIARPLARRAGVEIALSTVTRVRHTPSQAQLGRDERERNLRGAFACCERVDGKRVLVVDDVMTTGASLDAVAAALKASGASRVENLVVARTPTPL